jgi:uncharacterized cupredoxin-like copper-binding protein
MASLPLRAFALLATLALLPAADAATFSFGTIVAKTDYDYTPNPAGMVRTGLCTHDVDNNARYDPGEPLLLDLSGYVEGTSLCQGATMTGTIATDDIRLLSIDPAFAVGSMFVAGDFDGPRFTFGPAVPHFLRYFDAQTDGKFKAKDTLYIDLFDLASKKVGPGDYRLTAFGSSVAGTVVQTGDADVNMPLTELSGAGAGFGSDNLVYKAGSAYYVNTDAQALATTTASTGYNRDFVVEENDVRLNAKAENPLGDFNAPTFTVSDASVVSSKVVAGKLMQLKVTMKNTGKAAASALVETYVDDVLVDSRGTATIAPGKEGAVVISLPAPEEAGRAKLRVGKDALVFYSVEAASGATGGVSTSSIAVDAAPAAQDVEPLNAKAATKGAPGVSLLAMLGLVGVLAWMRRRD